MATFGKILTAAWLATFFAGCASPMFFHYPTILPDGTVAEQQRAGIRFDPYPDPDVGPPVVGGRPRDYQNPVMEPERSRFVRNGVSAGSWSNLPRFH